MGPLPAGAKPPPALPKVTSAAEARRILGDGPFGGPYDAPSAALDALFAAAVDAMAEALRDLR